ncbi:MAG: hypothetical protein CO184_00700 [Candidatus Zambryskibacteria bacterium CG_4_9_14_3_um_filter_40_16]|uniref:DNA polymerase III subunit delta n=2 Tax=Candidatus Zambryskiibacteriota TaxID=1817925 RepID=A0A2H0K7B6_9BACT|nr:MAG: hypothetical protein COV95_00255 [Candidatus Zambryskibacteria bacterium CG11_big_fil_rev_8_21_14_0_20_40_24]PJA34012.1 MAG: hypothetical protein CO184_00700 [Candidatus Zambryskibacteria bacterium CG_4_9_14_3_um_filter_40_16]
MNLSLLIKPESLHHAYGINGGGEETLPELISFVEDSLGISTHGNSDVWIRSYETLGIDESKFLKGFSTIKPVFEKKIMIVSFKFITNEAQNSLLKLLEEPSVSTHLFLIFPSLDILLPTLASRLFVISDNQKTSEVISIKEFLYSTMENRIKFLNQIIEGKNKSEAINFLNQLEEYFYKKTNFSNIGSSDAFVLEEIMKSRDYLKDRSPSVKLILEHIAGIVPSI